MRILVTGGAGFIGSHTVSLLLAKNIETVVFDNLSAGKIANLTWAHSKLCFIQGDILDYQTLFNEIKKVDVVLHLAALSSVEKSIEDPPSSLQVNVNGFVNVLQAIKDAKKNIRLVYASSAAIYGKSEKLPLSDEAPLIPNLLSPYALEKLNNEYYAHLYYELFGIKSLGLRYFNVYGRGQDAASHYAGVIAKFIKNYQENNDIILFGDGNQSRDFIYIDDIVNANFLAINSDYVGVVNIATGVTHTLNDCIKYLEEIGRKKAKIQYYPFRKGDIKQSYAAIQKAKDTLAFSSVIHFKEGIRRLLAAS